MKEVVVTTIVEGISPKDYFNLIYSDAKCFAAFQRDVGKDPEASAGAWKDGVRRTNFRMKLNLPAMMLKMIGTNCIEVIETQHMEWLGDGSLLLDSQPALNFTGSHNFTTKAQFKVTATEARACKVECTMACSANMPWALQSTVETAMAGEARASVTKYMEYCKKYCMENMHLLTSATSHEHQEEESPSGHQEEGSEESDEDSFFDAEDTSSLPSSSGGGGRERHKATVGSAGSTRCSTAMVQSGSQPDGTLQMAVGRSKSDGLASADQVMVLAVQQLQLSSIESARAMTEMAALLRDMNASITTIRQVIAPGGREGYASWGGQSNALQLAGNGRVMGTTGTVSSSRAFASGLLFGIAAASAAGMVFLRAQQRSG